MSNKGMLRDKLAGLQIEPSDRVWQKVERHLEDDHSRSGKGKWSVVRMVAAALLVLVAFFVGLNLEIGNRYMPITLEINDQASDLQTPSDLYIPQNAPLNYRTDGRLVPNYQELWDHGLVPKVN